MRELPKSAKGAEESDTPRALLPSAAGPRARLFALALLLLAPSPSCRTTSPNTSGAPPAQKAERSLSAEDRRRVLQEIWQTINDNYYDASFNGVDWAAVRERYLKLADAAPTDFEFYGLCELMTAELRDSHTHYEPPAPPPDPSQPAADEPRGAAGLTLGEAEGRTAVLRVEPNSAAERAGVRPGMIVRAVNGRPVEEVEAEIRRRVAGASSERSFQNVIATSILYGRVWGLPRRLRLELAAGREFEYEVVREPREDVRVEARRLASGFAYIGFDAWRPPAGRRFGEELDKLRDAPGLVIDLRGNGGGQTDVLLEIASNFFPRETYYGAFRRRDGLLDKYFTRKPARHYDKPVCILVDEKSGSASETFALFFQEAGRARIIGRQSAGSTHNMRVTRLPHGGTVRYSIRAYVTPQGRDPEGTGVLPDESVPLLLSDLREGRDAPLEAAENWLRASARTKN
ncbi:MAG TPA: S41 family peptidase [Pyrinomonadaceae bacterium]|nr:S41 family peptidase [Pyrinomonadaceae bacterium]